MPASVWAYLQRYHDSWERNGSNLVESVHWTGVWMGFTMETNYATSTSQDLVNGSYRCTVAVLSDETYDGLWFSLGSWSGRFRYLCNGGSLHKAYSSSLRYHLNDVQRKTWYSWELHSLQGVCRISSLYTQLHRSSHEAVDIANFPRTTGTVGRYQYTHNILVSFEPKARKCTKMTD